MIPIFEPVAILPFGSNIITPSVRSTCGICCITKSEAEEYQYDSLLMLFTESQIIEAYEAGKRDARKDKQ